ncbi:Protein RUPTURED POLLEN GRAIN 1 [Musa troglodytarum]|uniref:Sugar transporter SWEET1 n=1 Tax=Musa troglodytarum TaxID=320322 RepID=A0A9E7G6T8_9LILI|nr:Protein RUPTURED POLLEN GRAIN 1 [Musa troglodytarum]
MAGLSLDHPWAFTFGILGFVLTAFFVFGRANEIGALHLVTSSHSWCILLRCKDPLGVFLSLFCLLAFLKISADLPTQNGRPTFYRVCRRKSTEGFQSVPYVVALFSAMLWVLYAFLKSDAFLLITINSFGCVIESVYVVLYFTYAPKLAKILTAKLVLVLNVGMFGSILLLTLLLPDGLKRVHVLGWICMCFSVGVFVAPLSIIVSIESSDAWLSFLRESPRMHSFVDQRLVIRTKSVEFMPFMLSFFLTLSSIVWFTYGCLTKDKFVALPNVLGFAFGFLQMGLYLAFKCMKPTAVEPRLPEHIISISVLGVEIYPIDWKTPEVNDEEKAENGDRKEADTGEEKVEGMAAPHEENEVNHVDV